MLIAEKDTARETGIEEVAAALASMGFSVSETDAGTATGIAAEGIAGDLALVDDAGGRVVAVFALFGTETDQAQAAMNAAGWSTRRA